MFDHLYSRYIVNKIKAQGNGDPKAGFLKSKDTWVAAHYKKDGRKDLRRRYFMEQL